MSKLTVTSAIRAASDAVHMVHYSNNDYTVQHRRANGDISESHHMERRRAVAWAKTMRIEHALDLLGFPDAGAEASVLGDEEGRWDRLVRAVISERRSA